MMSHCYFVLPPARMDTTEQCNAVISHFNGKFIKMASGALGRQGGEEKKSSFLFQLIPTKLEMIKC